MATKVDEVKMKKLMADLAKNKTISKDDLKFMQTKLGKSKGKASKDKTFCVGAVKITTRGKVNEELVSDHLVYAIKVDDKKINYYKRCAKAVSDDELCKKHQSAKEANSENFMTFEEVKGHKDSILLSKTDQLEIKKTEKKGKDKIVLDADGNVKPIISVTITKKLQSQIEKLFLQKEKSDETEKSDEPVEKSDDENDVNDTEKQVEKSDDNDDEDATEAIEITTSDGKTFYLDENSKKIYDMDSDGESNYLGDLLVVKDKNAPISYNGDNCIVSKKYEVDDNEFILCVYSDKLYKLAGKNYEKVGYLEKGKDGKVKPVFDKKTKKI